MPTVTYQQPNPVGGLLSGLAGAFTGASEGEAIKEDIRRYGESAAENTRQFEKDMAFRLHTLEKMSVQNLLDREAQSSLEALRQGWGSNESVKRFKEDLDKQAIEIADIQKRHQISIDESKRAAIEGEKTQRYSISEATKRAAADRDAEGVRFIDQSKRIEAMKKIKMQYGDPTTWTDKVKVQALSQYIVESLPSGSTTGAAGVLQASEQLKQARTGEFEQFMIPGKLEDYEAQELQAFSDYEKKKAEARAAGEVSGATKGAVDIASPAKWALYENRSGVYNKLTGTYPLNLDTPILADGSPNELFMYREQIGELEDDIIDLAIEVNTQVGSLADIPIGYNNDTTALRTRASKIAASMSGKIDPSSVKRIESFLLMMVDNSLAPPKQSGPPVTGLVGEENQSSQRGPSGPPTGNTQQ